jgi:uncharacterized cofD-like protein
VRDAFKIPAPGDLRHSLTALAHRNPRLAELLEHRLVAPDHPHLDGMPIGNLTIAALTQRFGHIGEAARHLAELLEVDVAVLPASVEDLHLAARLVDGTVVRGETEVRALDKPALDQVFVEGAVDGVWQEAREALVSADGIVVGPGSLYTSLCATLAIPGLSEAVRASGAPVVFICNTTTQPGQTDGMDAPAHVAAIARHLGRVPDVVLLNTALPGAALSESLARDGLVPLRAGGETIARIEAMGASVVASELLAPATERRALYSKMDTAYHDAGKTADLILEALSVERQSEPLRVVGGS